MAKKKKMAKRGGKKPARAKARKPAKRAAAKRAAAPKRKAAAAAPARVDHGALEAARHGIARSPEWPRVERQHLVEQPECQACPPGQPSGAPLQVHHIFPFHYCVALGRADLELDQRNLITLCEDEKGRPGQNHHLLVGHLDDFQSSNLNVVQDAEGRFKDMTAGAIRANAAWIQEKATKLTPLDLMTDAEKQTFVAEMNKRFPKLPTPAAVPAG